MASVEMDIPRRERRPRMEGGDSYRPPRRSRSRSRERERGREGERERARPARRERARTPPPARTEEEKQAAAKAEYEKLLNVRSGGTYIPPARLRALQAQITDKKSKEYQRMAWEALKKSINGLINKVNTANIKHIVPELFGENLVRGRGLFCRSIMKAQAASLPFTPIYAAMAAIVNTKLPQVGELLVKRLVMQFRKGFKRNDKAVCLASTTFLAHLINHQVQHEMLAGQMLLLLLHKPTDDSVEIAVGFCREVGQYVEEMQPSIAMAVFDQFRSILHEADIDKRTQYMIEVLFQVRKDKFKDNPAIKEELDLVEDEDQITHQVSLEGEIDVEDGLNIFKYDAEWEEHEEAYRKLKADILGEGSDDDDDDDGDDDADQESSDEEDEETKAMEIKDQTNVDLVNLRRTIYLTIMSSADPEEAVHKLIKVHLPAGQEAELPSMIVECCSQEKTYTKFFGLIGERFAKINRLWCDLFEQAFAKYYGTIHRYDNNKLRNIAMLFGHMFASDALGWHCLSVIHLNEEETTSSSRIFIKILLQSIAEESGMAKLKERLNDEALRPDFAGIFPRDSARNVRFSINYFTSIGMGALTEEMREFLSKMPKPALPAPAAAAQEDASDSDSVSSYSSYTSSSYSRTPSPSPSRQPQRRRQHSPSVTPSRASSPSPPPRRRDSRSPRGGGRRRDSLSPRGGGRRHDSPSPRRGRRRYSQSLSPSPRSPLPRRRSRAMSSSSSPSLSRSRPRSMSRSRSPSPARARSMSRSMSRSRSPTPARVRTSRLPEGSRSRPRRRASPSPVRYPSRDGLRDGRGEGRVSRPLRSRSPPVRDSRPPRRPSPSRTRRDSPPPRRREYGNRRWPSRSASPSRSPSPPPRRASPLPPKRRRYSDSMSPSPPPVKRERRAR